MNRITPQPKFDQCEQELKWLSEESNNTLHDYQSSNLIRLLINKVNELSNEVDYLRNRISQHDSFI